MSSSVDLRSLKQQKLDESRTTIRPSDERLNRHFDEELKVKTKIQTTSSDEREGRNIDNQLIEIPVLTSKALENI